ncbi:glutamate--tRNA ligase [Acidisoma cellulosilytica]|uniref:Glutamate--tRNA ligase n=1 Tax=Acidisoma cellulosilyticum TaxID=2802395 RepID=A0A963Z619_9PROT|nr:glutamate--tRNA ligase [Acidisoma cellulosilyticum]MCB8883224.1 glutamate--tRNA ligase [Acidisoma cellulosilyticum]
MNASTPRLRFAPSPTGFLHVGNLRTAVANYLFARRHGGQLMLRMDDTDTARSKPEYEAGIQEDLRWLGIHWDDYARQSDRMAQYEAAADRLKAAGLLYPCFESEEELAAKRAMRLKRRLPPVYDREMLSLTAEQRATAEANGKVPYWRFKLSNGEVTWKDLVFGDRRVKLPSLSDPVLIRADGSFLYTFTSVVDDLEFGVTHIIRGEDHVTNTGIQIDLMRGLGGKPETIGFAHLPLLTDAEGGKLSKRFDSLSVRSLRKDGLEPDAIIAYLARLGSADDMVALTRDEVTASFDLGRMSHSAAIFDPRQLLGINRQMMHRESFADVASRLPQGATEDFWLSIRGNLDLLSEARVWWEILAEEISPPIQAEDADFLRAAADALPAEPWDKSTASLWTKALGAATGRKGRGLYHPLRLALTGEESGPDLKDLLPLIGREKAARRLIVSAG